MSAKDSKDAGWKRTGLLFAVYTLIFSVPPADDDSAWTALSTDGIRTQAVAPS